MPSAKVAITLERDILSLVDQWVKEGRYPNRSRAIGGAIMERARHWNRNRLAQALMKLNSIEERALSEEHLSGEEWPEY